jgi:hypothetical protein
MDHNMLDFNLDILYIGNILAKRNLLIYILIMPYYALLALIRLL